MTAAFDQLQWTDDGFQLDDLRFRFSHPDASAEQPDDGAFSLYKLRRMVEQYRHFFASRPDFHPEHLFGMGILDGGSVAFWFELLQPRKHVAIDRLEQGDNPFFRQWVERRGLEGRVRTYWDVNQGDEARLRSILDCEQLHPLDLVLDDASHRYEPTRVSFNVLFPRLRPGGIYVIEDWKSAFAQQQRDGRRHHGPTLVTLVDGLVRSLARSPAVADIVLYSNFVVVERADHPVDFALEPFRQSRLRRLAARVRRGGGAR